MQRGARVQLVRVAAALLVNMLVVLSTAREASVQEATTSNVSVVEMQSPADRVATDTDLPTPAGEITLALDRQLVFGLDPDALAGSVSHGFHVQGVDLQGLSSDQWAKLCRCPSEGIWGALPQHAFIVGLDQSAAGGTCQVVLVLPD